MSERTPSTEKPLPEVVVGVVTHNRGYPKTAIAMNLDHRNRETKSLVDVLDQLVSEGRLVERDGRYWLPEDAPDDA